MHRAFCAKAGILLCLLVISGLRSAQANGPALHWCFDRVVDGNTPELVSGDADTVRGKFRLTHGVKGQAIVMDGYTTRIIREADRVPSLQQAFTVQAWIALGACPWNWVPVAAQENTVAANSNRDDKTWPDDLDANSPTAGFFFGQSP